MLEEIRRATGNPNVFLRILDLGSMASVRDFAKQFLDEERRLDILVNNAGVSGNQAEHEDCRVWVCEGLGGHGGLDQGD